MAPESKRRKIDQDQPRRIARPAPSKNPTEETLNTGSKVHSVHDQGAAPMVQIDVRVQQARDFAVSQAQQEGCKGNFKIFDSPFGNFLIPVVPSRKQLLES